MAHKHPAIHVDEPPEPGPADGISPLQIDPEQQLATRAAWLYFIGNNTQAQIGKRLGLTRARVNRLLGFAREQGLVQINITGRMASCIELENRLAMRFGLNEAVVVPTPVDSIQLRLMIATAAGQYLGTQMRDNMSIGVGWGRTLRLSLSAVPRRSFRKLSVVSLIGGLTQSSAVNPHETASHLADIVGAQCYYFAGPAFTDSEATRTVLMNQPMLRDVFERGRKVDLAFLSVGDLTQSNTMAMVGLISAKEVQSLVASGVVGDVCSHWIDINGNVIDHPLNTRAVALPPQYLKLVPRVVLVSGGRSKVPVILGALRAKYANVLVTDEATAKSLLAAADEK